MTRGQVILVDDDSAVVSALRFSFEIEGFSVLSYTAAADFLSVPEPERPACLVVDQNMPGMTGLELTAELRRRGSRLPVIMITASLSAPLQARAAAVGITRVFEKPLFGSALTEAVADMLDQRGLETT